MSDPDKTTGCKEQPKHTPLPWVSKFYKDKDDELWGVRQHPEAPSVSLEGEVLPCGFAICTIVAQDTIYPVCDGEERANADFIVEACNNYATLTADLARMQKALKFYGDLDSYLVPLQVDHQSCSTRAITMDCGKRARAALPRPAEGSTDG